MNARFLVLSLLLIASNGIATINPKLNLSLGILRNGKANIAAGITIELGEPPKACYHDETTYVEAEFVEEKNNQSLVIFTVATKNETGAYIVRGLPRLMFATDQGSGSASLNCDGPGDSFLLVATVYR